MKHLYHREISWSETFDTDSARLIKTATRLSRHLQEYLDNDTSERRRFDFEGIMGTVEYLKTLESVNSFEVETENGFLTKCAVRVSYNFKKDICIVFREGLIVTAWLCSKDDKHSTLDKSKYDRL